MKWETSKENEIFINGFEMARGAFKKSDIYSTDALHSIAKTQMKDEKIIAVNRKVTRLDLGLVVERVEIEAVNSRRSGSMRSREESRRWPSSIRSGRSRLPGRYRICRPYNHQRG